MKNTNAENIINCIKEFIQTFSFAKNMELILDESNITEISVKYNENNSKVINMYSSYCIWLCMNEIYPSWFDISIHPAQFDTEMEAYECLLKYINEYHENKYASLCQSLIDNLRNIGVTDFVDIYSLIILAALVSDDKQKHINNILSVSHKTQECIHNIVEHLDKEEDKPNDNGALRMNESRNASPSRTDKEKEALKNEAKQLKDKIRSIEMENEKLSNLVAKQEQMIEEYKQKLQDLQKQINISNEKVKANFISQIEEQEKKIHELQTSLEKEKKDKSILENDYIQKIKELEDEQNILKQENSTIDDLQNKIKKYAEKLETMLTVQNLNKELQEKLEQNTKKMVDMEIKMEKIQKESENVEKYKDKCADLDATLVNLRTENDKLKHDLIEKGKLLEKIKKELDAKVMSYEILKKGKHTDNLSILNGLDQTEELIRAKKEIENLKKQLGLDTNERSKKLNDLENEVDDLRRINEKLEQKISELIGKDNDEDEASIREKYEMLIKESEMKQKKIEELTDTNQKILLQVANFKGSDDSAAKEKIIKLEAELMIEKKNAMHIEETIKNKLNKEFNTVLQILKEQLQIRERENEHYKKALKSQIDTSNDEQKLLSGVIHSLGLKYKQLQTYNLSLRNEIAGIKLRKEKFAETDK